MPEQPEADSRFLLANERTYLAYVRTALALMVAGAALANVDLFASNGVARVIGALLLLTGVAVVGGGYLRWRSNDDRIRAGLTLEHTWFPLAMLVALAVLGLLTIALAVW